SDSSLPAAIRPGEVLVGRDDHALVESCREFNLRAHRIFAGTRNVEWQRALVRTGGEQGWSERQIKVEVFAIDNAVIVDLDGELLDPGIVLKISLQFANRASALGDTGD